MNHPRFLFPGALLLFCLLPVILFPGTVPTGFAELRLAEGLDGTTVNYAPDGRLFITQKKGIINIVKNGVMLPVPFLDYQLFVDNRNERGMQSMVFDPDFATNGYIYVYYSRAGEGRNRVSRFTANGDVVVPSSETLVVSLDALPGSIHNGGALFFKEGKLFITTGDGSNGSLAASFNSLLGKVLRVNTDGTIPTDNPFYQTLTGQYRMIYALGFRNPFRAAVQTGTQRVFINDVGGALFEEINELAAGKNYGWPSIEGKRTTQTAPANYQDPIYAYSHSQGCSIGGGAFYNPQNPTFPAKYIGKYFFGDYCGNYIKVLDPVTGQVIETFATNVNRPISFSVGDNGNFYYLARGGLAGGSNEANTQSCCSEVWQIAFTNNGFPTISAHPNSQVVPINGSAIFAVGASGSAPITYQWRRDGVNIPGATEYVYELTTATLDDNGAVFTAVITNPLGTVTSNGAVLTVSTNLPPVPVITLPTEGIKYAAGTTLTFAGTASDPEDGPLPPEAFSWEINFHHGTHTHPALPPTAGITGGTYGLSQNHDPASDVWYRIYLTVTDSQGQKTSVYRDVYPKLANITMTTNPSGLKLVLDGTEVQTPNTFTGVAGIQRSVEAPSPQVVNGITYTFLGWSDGGARIHEITTPEANTTLNALYLPFILEGESAQMSGASQRFVYAGFTGNGYADYEVYTNAFVEFTVNIPVQGDYVLDFRYANGSLKSRPLQVKVNDEIRVASLAFPPTGSWTTWTSARTTQFLAAGLNTIRLITIGFNGPNLDHLQVYQGESPVPVVAKPVFSVSSGTYTSAQQVNITSATSGAVIHYTTDGSTPTTASLVYNTSLLINASTTLKAIAVKSGMTNSAIETATYTITTGETPPFSVTMEAELALRSGAPVRMSYLGFTGTGYADYDGTADTYIEWTVNAPATGQYEVDFRYANGSSRDRPLSIMVNGVITNPRKSFPSTTFWYTWNKVTETVTLNSGTNTIRTTTIGLSGGNIDHIVVYSLTAPAPSAEPSVFNPVAGNYTAPVSVMITSATAGASIYYTLDGSVPSISSLRYESPVSVSSETTVKAIAIKNGLANSTVTSAKYTFNTGTTPVDLLLEAEQAIRSGVSVKFGYAGFTGTGYGDYINLSGDYIEWNVNVPQSGNYLLQFRYALPTGNRPLQLRVNGVTIEENMSFPATGSWTTWTYSSRTVALNAGLNTIRTTDIGLSGGNIDHIRVSNNSSTTAASLVTREITHDNSLRAPVTELNEHQVAIVNIYPVPVHGDILTVQSPSELSFIQLVDNAGKQMSPRVEQLNDNELRIDVSGLPPGITILMIKAGTQLVSRRVLIVK